MLILTVLQGPDRGRRYELPDNEPQLIGRSSEAIPTTDQTISRRHCELTPNDGRWYINDLGSSNGTYTNGVRVREGEQRRLVPGDQVRAGNTLFLFGIEASDARRHDVHVARKDEIDVNVESVAVSNDDSMILAVPEPTAEAVVQLRVIYELTQLIGSIVEREELLVRVMDLIFEFFHADRGFILLQESPEQRPDPIVVRHRHATEGAPSKIAISRTIVHHVLQKAEGVLSTNAMSDERFAGGDSVQDIGIRSAVCVPLRYKDRVYGVIHLDSQIINYTFTEDQLRLLTAVGVHTALALANAQLYTSHIERERLAAVGETVASLSHSVRNIIQGLRGGADVVELGLRKNSMKVVRGGWDIVARNLERIHGLTMNMLAYSKQRSPDLELTNLNPLLEEIVGLVQKQYDDKHVALITDLDTTVPPVPIDPAGIHQAMLNLLLNALDAVESKRGAVTLRTDFDDDGQNVRVVVTDNGGGIYAENRKRLFEPFHSTKGLKGTGLGLVVTKKIIDEHRGRIQVDSSPNTGTTFTLKLPAAQGDRGDTQSPG